jgi:hypothetical protein
MVHRCSNCPGQCHPQTVTQGFFQARDFDVENSIVYKQWFQDGHTEFISTITAVGEFTEKVCQAADEAIRPAVTGFIFEDVEINHSARH